MMDIMEEIVLSDKSILKAAIRERGETQVKLASKLGIRQNTLSTNMTRDRMGLDNFRKILNALGYDVAVVDRENGEIRWVVDPEENNSLQSRRKRDIIYSVTKKCCANGGEKSEESGRMGAYRKGSRDETAAGSHQSVLHCE